MLYTIIGSMAVSKLVDRLCKMGIIGTRNTIFFEGVDGESVLENNRPLSRPPQYAPLLFPPAPTPTPLLRTVHF